MAAYSQDLRDRVLAACLRGERPVEVADRFEVSRAWVYRVWQRYKTNGQIKPLQIGGYRRSKLEGHDQLLENWIQEQPDLTLVEMCRRLAKETGIKVGPSSLWYRLNSLGYTFKKNGGRIRTDET